MTYIHSSIHPCPWRRFLSPFIPVTHRHTTQECMINSFIIHPKEMRSSIPFHSISIFDYLITNQTTIVRWTIISIHMMNYITKIHTYTIINNSIFCMTLLQTSTTFPSYLLKIQPFTVKVPSWFTHSPTFHSQLKTRRVGSHITSTTWSS